MTVVAVVTSSLGRPTLPETIEAIRGQTRPAKHYVFINGPEYHAAGHAILDRYPEVKACYLPEPGTVGPKPGPEAVYVAAPFLVGCDILLYCNDDDVFEPDHVESLVSLMEKHGLAWAFSLRRAVDMNGAHVAEDDCESLGMWPCVYDSREFLVDCSSYAVRRELAVRAAPAWYRSPIGDRVFLAALKSSRAPFGCTGRSTVRYRLQPHGGVTAEFFARGNAAMAQRYPQGFPWRRPTVWQPSSAAKLD